MLSTYATSAIALTSEKTESSVTRTVGLIIITLFTFQGAAPTTQTILRLCAHFITIWFTKWFFQWKEPRPGCARRKALTEFKTRRLSFFKPESATGDLDLFC